MTSRSGPEPIVSDRSATMSTIGYSALADRASAIEMPAPADGVEIIVVVQGGEQPTRWNDRDDVTVIVDEGAGAARSRNVVLRHATGRYVLFADDDATPIRDGLDEIVRVLEATPDVSIVQGRAVDEAGRPRKRYPRRRTRLRRWNSAKIGTIELVVRRADLLQAGVRFDEGFGAGTERFLGDEFIFVADALRAGLRGVFLPVDVAVHPAESSGSATGTVEDARARAAVFDRVFGRTAPIARLAFLLRRPGRLGSVGLAARFVVGGRLFDEAGEEPEGPGGGDQGQHAGE